jgi:hypothetical protein
LTTVSPTSPFFQTSVLASVVVSVTEPSGAVTRERVGSSENV